MDASTIGSQVSSAKRIEAAIGDLDERLDAEGYEALSVQFSYSDEDERKKRPNPSPIPIDGNLRNGLASLKKALRRYNRFRNNIASKDAHSALVNQLTRAEIEAAMEECRVLGADQFLKEYDFTHPNVWIKGAQGEGSYPAKAIVAVALKHLPDGKALNKSEFFNGHGEAQSSAKLNELGYTLIGQGDENTRVDALSRQAVEDAMDAYDRYRQSGEHSEIFGSFGEPRDYWVRSTRWRQGRHPNPAYPTKPVVAYALSLDGHHGGWSTKAGAAAKLHNSGFLIVDKNNKPVEPPERYDHLIRGAKHIRLHALTYYILPALERGDSHVSIRAGDVRNDLKLKKRLPDVFDALEGEQFQNLNVPSPTKDRQDQSPHTLITFELPYDKDKPKMEADARDQSQTATNLILYGPPGTGKTYKTAWEAVRLCLGGETAAALEDDRDALMAEYRRLVREGRIEFVTFHQSMSYEEFVEGLRPSTGDDDSEGLEDTEGGAGFRLKCHEGIFKRISERARRAGLTSIGTGDNFSSVDLNTSVFKMSLGSTNLPEVDLIFDECIRDGKILLGCNPGIDLSPDIYGDKDAILKRTRQVPGQENVSPHSGLVSFNHTFRNEFETGSIVLISRGIKKIRAIGVVSGKYFYDGMRDDDYRHGRPVDWLWASERPETDIDVKRFYPNNFSKQTFHRLPKPIDRSVLMAAINPEPTDAGKEKRHLPNYVLIIDEINRANISKVFGELITLLEQDKRLGEKNEIRVRLPYSGDEFGVPSNLHILGTMNTADRSIALLDTALRRRFTFQELMPDTNALSDALAQGGLDAGNLDGIDLRTLLTTINDRIEYLFDREHRIGHAYFTGCRSRKDVEDAMRHKVIPLLAEYFYEDWSKVAAVLGDGPGAAGKHFLESIDLEPPEGTPDDDLNGKKLRWTVKEEFDFSEFED